MLSAVRVGGMVRRTRGLLTSYGVGDEGKLHPLELASHAVPMLVPSLSYGDHIQHMSRKLQF
jgi:hypothetical protein